MTFDTSPRSVSPLRARMIEDMTVRGFNEHTRSGYVRHVRAFAAFIGRSPDTATAEDLRLFQLHQTRIGMQPPSINSAVSALRFFFTVTLDRPDLARRLTVVPQPRRIPAVLSVEEVRLLLRAASGPKYKAAFATAYGAGLRVSEVDRQDRRRNAGSLAARLQAWRTSGVFNGQGAHSRGGGPSPPLPRAQSADRRESPACQSHQGALRGPGHL